MAYRNHILRSAAGVVAIAASTAAIAQTGPSAPEAEVPAPSQASAGQQTTAADASVSNNEEGEIIVTAQKREQALQDVPMTVTAATGEQLETAGVEQIGDLAKIVPALSVGRSQFGFPIISMRGVNLNLAYLSAQPTVSTYVDQALLAYPAMTQGVFLDVQRIEVLKGPQGTLFGANVTGGAINIIAAKPTRDLRYGARAEVNHFGGVDLEGYVSGPLSDTLRARIAASTKQFGAWQRCYFGCDQENGKRNEGAARLLLDWTPTETLTVSLNLNGNYDRGEPQQFQIASKAIVFPPGLPGYAEYPLPPADNRAADFFFPEGQRTKKRDRTLQAVLRVDLDLDWATLTSITNYGDTKRFANFDGDGSVLPLGFNQTFGRIKSFNQELRLGGAALGNTLNYVLGAAYQDDEILDGQSAQWFGYSGIPVGSDALIENPVTYRSVGLFASGDWEFTPGLTLTLGGRYAWMKETTGGCFADAGSGQLAGVFGFVSGQLRAAFGQPPLPAGTFGPGKCFALDDRPEVLGTERAFSPFNEVLKQKEKNFSWKAGLSWEATDDVLLYGLVSRGFKAGSITPGYNTVATQFAKIKQEQLTAYELGIKSQFADRRITFNAAAFYYDYKDKQFATIEPGIIGDQPVVVNIPKSKVKGFETELLANVTRNFTLRASLTYLDTEVGPYVSYVGLGTFREIEGTRFNLAPEWSGNIDAEYRAPIASSLEGYVGASFGFNSSTYGVLGEPEPYFIKAWQVFDARIGIESQQGWSAGLFARNLTDEYYWNNATSGNDAVLKTTGMPRTFGAVFSYRF
jgi:outer membrane receptor protein involved in Fe transport